MQRKDTPSDLNYFTQKHLAQLSCMVMICPYKAGPKICVEIFIVTADPISLFKHQMKHPFYQWRGYSVSMKNDIYEFYTSTYRFLTLNNNTTQESTWSNRINLHTGNSRNRYS